MSSRAAEISANLQAITARIVSAAESSGRDPEEITLIAVTKTFPVSDVKILYELGIRDFGENRDQEGSVKFSELPGDSNWHFQGQIQSNKLKSIAAWADVIHSIDDISHARKLSSLVGAKDIFVQVSLDGLPGRGGVNPEQLLDFLAEVTALANLKVRGLMAVAPLDEPPLEAFKRLKALSETVIKTHPNTWEISAGMSNDFEAAISQGATHIRIGSQILGVR
jgi:pyridoxal phosphate enzyme (YggS family)